MAYYFIATALAAVATLSSAAVPIEDDKEDATTTEEEIHAICPDPNWERNKAYHVYSFPRDVHKYYNCGHHTTIETCPNGLVFDPKKHYCTWDIKTSKDFKCPELSGQFKLFKYFADPNFENQYHKCWGIEFFKAERRACPHNKIFNQSHKSCVQVNSASH